MQPLPLKNPTFDMSPEMISQLCLFYREDHIPCYAARECLRAITCARQHKCTSESSTLRAWKRRKSATLGLIVQACGKGWRICGNTTEFLLSNDTFPKAKKLNYPCPMESFEPVCGCPTTSDGNGLHPTSDRIIEKLSQYCVTPGLLLCETVKPLVIRFLVLF